RAPSLPQGASPFAERMEDVEGIVEVGQAVGATAGTLEFDPFAQAGPVVPDHRFQCRESGEFLGPGDAVAGLDHPTRHPAEALGLDPHQAGSAAKKISPAVPCLPSGRAASSSTLSNGPACLAASRVARPSVATARGDRGPDTTRKSRRATLKLTPSPCAT